MKNQSLTHARKNMELTQEELAGMLGYQKATVSNWENGYSNPSLTDAFKVAEILGKDINDIFSGLKVQVSCTDNEKREVI
ncbi:helix-turn-helix transcriptional regulator [Paenibacillus sp. FSL E2-0178]|uniref:helix-turn-helix transcriptional regulator n=1 Tax=Paenibacillus sp. FSL E2-0178 TaxID=2921361 RepID=UPI0031584FE0